MLYSDIISDLTFYTIIRLIVATNTLNRSTQSPPSTSTMKSHGIMTFLATATTINGFSPHSLKRPIALVAQSSSRLGLSASSRYVSSSATNDMKIDAEKELGKLEDFYSRCSFSTPTFWNSRSDAATFVEENIDTVLFDCDGVLYRTLDPCPGATYCIQGLLDKGKKVLFVTNNAAVNRRQLRDKLTKVLGIDSLTTEQMISSSYACAQYLKAKLSPGSRVHVIGSDGLCEELENSGFATSGGPSPGAASSMSREELADYDFSEHPIDALAVGHDVEMNFRKLCVADNLLLRNPEALFVATNKDSFDLVGSDRRHIAGNGCTVKALEYCSKRNATNVGKPSETLADLIVAEHGLDPSRALFVGDRLDTDILFGNKNGMKSLLVMTGVTNHKTMIDLNEGTDEEPLPSFIAPYVGLLV